MLKDSGREIGADLEFVRTDLRREPGRVHPSRPIDRGSGTASPPTIPSQAPGPRTSPISSTPPARPAPRRGWPFPTGCSINRLHTEHDPIQPGEAFCSKTSLNFVDSLWELFSAWTHGACVTLIPDAALPDPALLVEAIAASEATRLVLVPSLLRNLLESETPLGREAAAPPPLDQQRRTVAAGSLSEVLRASARPHSHEPLRHQRSLGRDPLRFAGPARRRTAADRAGHGKCAGIYRGSGSPAGAGGRSRRAAGGRRGSGARLLEPTGTDGGEIHPRSLRGRNRRASLPDGRRSPLVAGWPDRASWTA